MMKFLDATKIMKFKVAMILKTMDAQAKLELKGEC